MPITQVKEIILEGTPICRGISIGKLYFYDSDEITIQQRSINPLEIDREIERYRFALFRTFREIKYLQKQLKQEAAFEGISILDSQIEMLKDPMITIKVEESIRSQNKNAEFIFQKTLQKYKKKFDALKDSFFAERFKDLQDLGRRVLCHLKQTQPILLENIPAHSVLCMQELSLSEAAKSDPNHICAFITQQGGITSHTAVIAKSKGIPYITHINLEVLKEWINCTVIVDARFGKVIINPSDACLASYQTLQEQRKSHIQEMGNLRDLPAATLDGHAIRVYANIEVVHEVDLVHQSGGEGIGLFRSEYMFLSHQKPPSEEEQFVVYQNLVQKMRGLPLVIRVFDWIGDKNSGYYLNAHQDLFPTQRTTRFLLSKKDFLKSQLRAILRNCDQPNVSILFPMISTLSDFLEVKKLVRELEKELKFKYKIRLGCMIEVPSSALLADLFAKECDFFSIGTNDLAQYVLAANREDSTFSDQHGSLDPSVIRLIQMVIKEAAKEGLAVSICGEVASDPRFIPLLLGLGIREFSVAPRFIPMIKNTIRRIKLFEAIQLTEKILPLRTAREVLEVLSQEYYQKTPEDLEYGQW